MPGARLLDCFGIVEEGRMLQVARRDRGDEKGGKATEAGMKAGIEACAPGVTENEIAASHL